MSETLVRPEELVEAVIISGPRKGEIVSIDLDETLAEEDVARLEDAFKKLNLELRGAVRSASRLGDSVKSAREAITENR